MANNNEWYEAETCAGGGYLCGHHHRTAKAAEKCLPKLPKQRSGSLTRMFSLASIFKMDDGGGAREVSTQYEPDRD